MLQNTTDDAAGELVGIAAIEHAPVIEVDKDELSGNDAKF